MLSVFQEPHFKCLIFFKRNDTDMKQLASSSSSAILSLLNGSFSHPIQCSCQELRHALTESYSRVNKLSISSWDTDSLQLKKQHEIGRITLKHVSSEDISAIGNQGYTQSCFYLWVTPVGPGCLEVRIRGRLCEISELFFSSFLNLESIL